MNFKTEFLVYIALFFVFGVALGFSGIRQLLPGDERRAIFTLLGSLVCFFMPYLLVRVLNSGGDNDDDTNEPDV
jgi:predicted alpha/beta hydrolase